MSAETAVIICPGPSSKNVMAEDFPGRTVIAVLAAARMRDFRCAWWVCEDTWPERPVIPPALNVVNGAAPLSKWGVPGVDTREMRRAAGCPEKGYNVVAVDALILAAYLGFKAVDVYGADWTGEASLAPGRDVLPSHNRRERMTRESVAWREVSARTGVRVNRVGAETREISEYVIHWAGATLPGTVPPPQRGRMSNDARREDIARLEAEIAAMDAYEAWLGALSAMGVAVPELQPGRGVTGIGSVAMAAGVWATVGPGVEAAIGEGRLGARVEERKMFALPG